MCDRKKCADCLNCLKQLLIHANAYAYDVAGRASSFSGNLGDGAGRNYSTEIIYSPRGGITKEKFGTDTALYNKLFYNSRGQLAEIRESTSYTGPTDTSWNRGAIINHYSDTCWGMCGGTGSTTPMTDIRDHEEASKAS